MHSTQNVIPVCEMPSPGINPQSARMAYFDKLAVAEGSCRRDTLAARNGTQHNSPLH